MQFTANNQEDIYRMPEDFLKTDTSITALMEECVYSILRGTNVNCYFSIPENLWPAAVDREQIKKVIQSLMVHSVRKIPSGGTIELGAENTTFYANATSPLKKGEYIKILITEYGSNTPTELSEDISNLRNEKECQEIELGLAAAHSIIKKLDGSMTINSKPGAWTTVTLYLPASTRGTNEKKVQKKTLTKCKYRVLVMEDDEVTRSMLGEMLSQCEFEPEFAVGGSQAIKLYKQAQESGHPFDVLIIDLKVPGGMGGKETIKEILKIDPQAKAILSTGSMNYSTLVNSEKLGFSGVMAKPYNITDLNQTLREVLDR